MRKTVIWTTATIIALTGAVGYWALSGFSTGGTMTYDLKGSSPSQHPGQSWRHKASQLLLPLLYSHDTQYAARYREGAFRALRPGGTEEDVRAALGDPLDETKLEDGRIMWHFTKPGPKTRDFFLRIVEFDPAKRVVRTHAEFYVD